MVILFIPGHDLSDEPVQIGVGGSQDVQIAPAQVVDGFVIHHEGALTVLQSRVRVQHSVVRLHYGRRYL